MIKIFVYGTLLYSDVQNRVYGRSQTDKKATLKGYRKDGLNILKDENSTVYGLILEVAPIEEESLDYYESLGRLYRAIKVKTEEYGEVKAYQLL